MAFKFNAILDFQADQAVAGMSKAKAGFTQFKDGVAKANASLGQMAGGAQSGAIALAPLTAGFGLAMKDAAEFEHGMAAVQSTMLETKDNMRPLMLVTKQLGAATKFSAVEATQGAMFFAQAGFDMQQIIAALPGAMDAAAAGEIDLATTTDIMASSMGAFGLEAKRAGEVADVLALAASLTNTDMIGLGEGLKYSASTAKTAGMSIQDTSFALGTLANAGLKGSMGGTALQAALLKLADPTKEVLGLFGGRGGFNEAILDSTGKLLPFEVIMANMSKVVAQSANPLEAAGVASEIFGLRGAKAFGAFTGQLQDTVTVNDVMLERFKKAGVNIEKEGIAIGSVIPKLVALRYQINGAEGAAKQMAEIRMSSFLGQLEQLKGATQGLSIEVGELFLGSMTGGSKVATDAMAMLTFGFQALTMTEEEAAKLQSDVTDKNSTMFNQFGAFLPMFRDFGAGFKEGIGGVIEGLKEGFVAVKEFFGGFSDSGFSAKEIGKLVAQVVLIGAMLAPVLAGIIAFAFVMGPIFSAISGFFGLISAGWGMATGAFIAVKGAVVFLAGALGVAVGPFLLIAAAVIGIIALIVIFRKEIVDFALTAYDHIMKFFHDPFSYSFTEIGAQFGVFGKVVGTVLDFVTFGFKALAVVISTFAGLIYDFLVMPIINNWETIKSVFMVGVQFVTSLFTNQLLPIFTGVFDSMVALLTAAGTAFVNVGGAILNFWKGVGEGILVFFGFVFERIGTFFSEVVFGSMSMGQFITDTLSGLGAVVANFFTTAFSNAFAVVEAGVTGFMGILKAFGQYMLEIFLAPFRAILGFIAEVVTKIAEFVPNSLLEKVGLSQSDLKGLIGATTISTPTLADPGAGGVTDATRVAKDNNKLNQSMLQQTALVQPPSADDISSILSSQSATQSKESGGAGGQQTVKVVVEGRIRGQDLNLSMTRAQVEQSQLNGRSPEPIVKRRAVQNGQQFGG